MASTNLIIALVFATLFGAALIWLFIYFIYEYVHQRCIELGHWLRRITPPSWRRPCRHCEGTGRDYDLENEKSRSRSKSMNRHRSRSRVRGRREISRMRRGGRDDEREMRMIEEGMEWSADDNPRPMQRPRQVLSVSPAMQRPMVEGSYNTWQGQANIGQQMAVAYPQAAIYPQVYPQMYPQTTQQPYQQAPPFMMPMSMPQQQAQQMAMPIPESVKSVPTFRNPIRKAYTAPSERSRQTIPQPKPKVHKARETDYIHIVDEYPPIVQESIKKKKKKPAASAAARRPPSLTSSSSSTSTESAEEVPRASIPQGTPRFADPLPYQSTQYPPPWNVQTSYPRHWNRNTNGQGRHVEKERYTSPHTSPERRM